MVVTSFSNDESACPPTQMLLKTDSNTDILIYQVRKFEHSYFKAHVWKDATVLQKAYCLRACYEIRSW